MKEAEIESIESELERRFKMPLDCIFLVGGIIYAWLPLIGFRALVLEEFGTRCMRYLQHRDRVYASLTEAAEAGVREKWSNWQQLERTLKQEGRR